MELDHINEPRLQFAADRHICPRRGITAYGVFDRVQNARREKILLGGVGTNECLEQLEAWLDRCKGVIDAPDGAAQPNLFVPFCGFNAETGFAAELVFGSDLSRPIRNSDIDHVLRTENYADRVNTAVELYYEHVKFLAQNRQVDVIVCIIPDSLYEKVARGAATAPDDSIDSTVDVTGEINFRRALKARALHLGKPLQLVRTKSLLGGKGKLQDDATRAWNFCTAIYYKSGPTIPWKLPNDPSRPSSCAVGIAFYRSRDRSTVNTSLAQVFDELGNGLILRGTPVSVDKADRVPYLTIAQAHELLTAALHEYRVALRTYPARVVIHKSSDFRSWELDGFTAAAIDLGIDTLDCVTVTDSRLVLFREGIYPPYRGTRIQVSRSRQLLYSRGSVWYYGTYPGQYVPHPIEIRTVCSEQSPASLAHEVLALTKMNWNDTQLDGKYPVSLGCARRVGEILKYVPPEEAPQVRYGFYM